MNDQSKNILKKKSINYPSWVLTDRQICDLEMILSGGFSPLSGFLGKNDYESVINDLRLDDGTLWPIPIMLDVPSEFTQSISIGNKITLKDKEGFSLAIMEITDIWEPDRIKEAKLVFGTDDDCHPGVDYLLNECNPSYIGGPLDCIESPHHYDYQHLRHTPKVLKQKFQEMGWNNIVAFQTRNPLHRAHVEMTLSAMKEINANLLIHPVVGMTKPGDVDHYTRVRCYNHVLDKYPDNSVMLSLLPLAMRMGGPREALWHAIIRKNYGCTHLIVGRDHAGPGNDKDGNPFYGPYDAQDIIKKYKDEIGIQMVPFKFLVYLPDQNSYKPIDEVPDGIDYKTVSGSELRKHLDEGNVNILAGDSCFYDQDLEGLNDLISLNELQYDSALELGTQTWFNGRLKILVAGNYGNSAGVNDTIYTLPETIGNWTSLSGLYLEWNRISLLPESFNMLTELRSLYISNNILRSIIEDIDSLSHLTYLDLGYNEIDSLPSSLCNLNELQYLWLFNNNLTTLPDCICSMSIDWSSDDSAWFPYFAIGGNRLCENVPDCISNSENFNVSLDQFYYSFQIEAQQECDNVMIDASSIFPSSIKIDSPYPNPFNPTTSFEVRLLKNEELTIAVYDIKGFLVDIIFDSHASKGLYKFNWNASEFSSGIYFVELKTSRDRLFKKVILTK